MQLLISDANILVDLEEGGLLEAFFSLPYQFAVPDIMFAEELETYYPHLPELGLQTKELTGKSLSDVFSLNQKYPNPSTNDCFALALAKQEGCPLITGDRALRAAAGTEGVIVMGTLWTTEQLVIHAVISAVQAHAAYEKMKAAGSRLPWDLAHKRIDELITDSTK